MSYRPDRSGPPVVPTLAAVYLANVAGGFLSSGFGGFIMSGGPFAPIADATGGGGRPDILRVVAPLVVLLLWSLVSAWALRWSLASLAGYDISLEAGAFAFFVAGFVELVLRLALPFLALPLLGSLPVFLFAPALVAKIWIAWMLVKSFAWPSPEAQT
jgi:hypothetical protein